MLWGVILTHKSVTTSPYADRIPAIAKVGGWHGGTAPTEYELLQVGTIPLWFPAWLAARDSSSAVCVTSVTAMFVS
jgi:hypothetical protein